MSLEDLEAYHGAVDDIREAIAEPEVLEGAVFAHQRVESDGRLRHENVTGTVAVNPEGEGLALEKAVGVILLRAAKMTGGDPYELARKAAEYAVENGGREG